MTTPLRLSTFLPFRLSVLSNTISRRIADRYQREFGLTIWQWRVLAVLGERPGLSASEITQRTAMDKVAVSRAVASLIERGEVWRESDQGDGRRSLLRLSASGEEIYRQITPLAVAIQDELVAAMPPDEMARLGELLDRLADAVSPHERLW